MMDLVNQSIIASLMPLLSPPKVLDSSMLDAYVYSVSAVFGTGFERERNIEICTRQWGRGQPDRLSDADLAWIASAALEDAEKEARAENAGRDAERRALDVEIFRRVTGVFASWVRYPDEIIRAWAERAIELAWAEAIVENVQREREKKIAACVGYFKLRDYSFFDLLDADTLDRWHSAISPFPRITS
ncbi:hypothetical protein [Paraburkholderia caffeinitolerans]|nr:hypothetical protein [Paraburkholderia caffeinitolerans]